MKLDLKQRHRSKLCENWLCCIYLAYSTSQTSYHNTVMWKGILYAGPWSPIELHSLIHTYTLIGLLLCLRSYRSYLVHWVLCYLSYQWILFDEQSPVFVLILYFMYIIVFILIFVLCMCTYIFYIHFTLSSYFFYISLFYL